MTDRDMEKARWKAHYYLRQMQPSRCRDDGRHNGNCDVLTKVIATAIKEEREACAVVAEGPRWSPYEDYEGTPYRGCAERNWSCDSQYGLARADAATAIRKRGEG